MRFLKTNTATRVTVGPFLDKTDGITPETAITVTGCHLTLMVDTAGVPTLSLDADATASGGNNDMVHVTGDDAGFYDLELTAAQLNYVGRAMLSINNVGVHCPVFHEFMILPANIYDSIVSGTDLVDVSVTQFAGSAITSAAGIPEVKVASLAANAITATAIATDAITAGKIAADAIGASELAADAASEIGTAVWATATRVLTAGTNIALAKGTGVTGFNDLSAAAVNAEVDTALADYDAPTKAELDSGLAGLNDPTAAAVADAVLDEATSGHSTAGTVGKALTDILADTNELQSDDYPTSIAAVKSDTAAILIDTAEIGTAGAGLTNINLPNQAMDITGNLSGSVGSVTGNVGGNVTGSIGSLAAQAKADVNAEADTALTDYDGPTHAEMTSEIGAVETDTQDIQSRLPAALTGAGNLKSDLLAISGDASAADALEGLMDGIIVGQVNDLSASVTSFAADGFTASVDDHFNGRLITFITGALAGQQTAITDYAGSGQTFTVDALTSAPANDVFFVIS